MKWNEIISDEDDDDELFCLSVQSVCVEAMSEVRAIC